MGIRESFEAWYQRHYPTATPSSYSKINGRYVDVEVSVAWEAWQAALSHIGDGSKAEPVGVREEQEAFEKFASGRAMNMEMHPLHYLFLDEKTDAARAGWRAALDFMGYTHPAPTAQDSKVPGGMVKILELAQCALITDPYDGNEKESMCFECKAQGNPIEHEADCIWHTIQAMLSAAPVPDKPQWVRCEERLPKNEDADPYSKVWVHFVDGQIALWRWWDIGNNPSRVTHWKATGLQRPEAPEGE